MAMTRFKPQRGKFTLAWEQGFPRRRTVSNPNGVNLHALSIYFYFFLKSCFKPQRGKFTQNEILSLLRAGERFKPQRGKFTLKAGFDERS